MSGMIMNDMASEMANDMAGDMADVLPSPSAAAALALQRASIYIRAYHATIAFLPVRSYRK